MVQVFKDSLYIFIPLGFNEPDGSIKGPSARTLWGLKWGGGGRESVTVLNTD